MLKCPGFIENIVSVMFVLGPATKWHSASFEPHFIELVSKLLIYVKTEKNMHFQVADRKNNSYFPLVFSCVVSWTDDKKEQSLEYKRMLEREVQHEP